MTVAAALVAADLALQRGLARWDGSGAVPAAVAAAALSEQRLELRLGADRRLYRGVLRRLPARLARDVADDVQAHVELARLTPPRPLSAFRVGRAAPADDLRRFYAEGERRSGVPWQVLAAVNYVESDFGRVRNESTAGAQGPMQFLPSTWRAYGRGDVHDPRQAILAAARFLRAAGAPGDLRGALYRYNPSRAYVDAIVRLASRFRRERPAFLGFYARRLIVRTPGGYRRLTGFSRARSGSSRPDFVIENPPRRGCSGADFVTRSSGDRGSPRPCSGSSITPCCSRSCAPPAPSPTGSG